LHSSGKADRRKLGLFFAACCSRIPPSMYEGRSRRTDWDDDTYDPIALTSALFHLFSATAEAIRTIGSGKGEQAALATLFRDVFGPLLFRPVALNRAWRTPTVTALVTAAYEDRPLPAGTLDNDRLAVLADALEDADCAEDQILNHLRSPGPHVR